MVIVWVWKHPRNTRNEMELQQAEEGQLARKFCKEEKKT